MTALTKRTALIYSQEDDCTEEEECTEEEDCTEEEGCTEEDDCYSLDDCTDDAVAKNSWYPMSLQIQNILSHHQLG